MNIKKIASHSICIVVMSFAVSVFSALESFAQTSASNIDFAVFPSSNVGQDAAPQVMMTLSADHQYFFKAYSDFSDLDPSRVDENGDPDPNGAEITYVNEIEYYGYFDPNKCYNYDTGTGRFSPQAFQNPTTPHYCDNVVGDWSGNFLNWSTMTRMDVVRKIFYGGFRSTDTATLTVLERAHLPFDAHSFAKYYNGDDIPRLTPFSAPTITLSDGDGVDEINEGITICNTSPDDGTVLSEESTAAPVMRVVRGNFSLWAANERWQCTWDDEAIAGQNQDNGPDSSNGNNAAESGINAFDSDPNRNTDALGINGVVDRIVRVEVCNDINLIDLASNDENCRIYPDGNYKSSGILHQFGEDGQIEFGLMTGGFQANTEGGVLRKRIRSFADEVNIDTDGRFARDADGTRVAGIVTNIDALRMVGYRYSEGIYFGGESPDSCNFQQTDIAPNECFSWGNPISEILLESVNYLTGGTATGAFNVNDEGRLEGVAGRGAGIENVPGLSIETFNGGPLDEDNQCAAVTQIVINASVSSFDENLASAAALPGAPDIATFTNDVGVIEGLAGNDFFVGAVTADGTIDPDTATQNELCTSKTVNNLSEVRGICPEAPTVAGSYAAAGIAFYAATNDLRPAFEGDQVIQTLGITLATNAPVIEVPLGPIGTEESIDILPAYRLQAGGNVTESGGGALVDFRIVQNHQETAAGSGIFTGTYYLNWEDSEQGGDFDNDVWGTLSYELNLAANTIEITTNAVTLNGGGRPQLFGFITAGTTQDGFHAYSGVLGATSESLAPVDELAPDNGGVVPSCDNCTAGSENAGGQTGAQSYTFRIDPTATVAESLQPPLYYAAKFGSFIDTDGNDEPNLVSEFDQLDNITGEEEPDGVPDGFFAATSPQTLVDSVENALNRALNMREGSGAAPATLTNSDGSAGIVVQGLFFENFTTEDNETITWTGDLLTYFTDDNGFFREDGNGNGSLDDIATDPIFSFDFNLTLNNLEVTRFNLQNPNDPFDADSNPLVELETVDALELEPIWSASDALLNLDNDAIVTNRDYESPVSNDGASRYIFSWIDEDGDGESQPNEVIDFESDEVGVDSLFQSYLGFHSDSGDVVLNEQAQSIVDYIRGFESPTAGLRNRTIDATTDGDGNVTDLSALRLGDIVNSSPTLVAAPTENYDVLFGDDTYAEFRNTYANRRNVVYVGGNDGLLHAFNAGFRELSVDGGISYEETLDGETAHPLGAELWAYAPQNLLPHYQWLTQPDYLHVFYMDGEPAVFDVNIFNDDDIHPGGWGTILVVGMRLGGGEFNLGFDGNDVDDDDEVTRSSYIVLDITDPESKPVLLGEISHEDLNHTTVEPVVYTSRTPGNGFNFNNLTGEDNRWTLVFGSGPDDRINFSNSGDASVFSVDLELSTAGVLANTDPEATVVPNPGGEGAMVGSMVATDWDPDFVDDVVYFGTVEGGESPTDHTGGLFRYFPDTGNTNLMLDTDRPIASTPLTSTIDGQNFVYAGTGRFLHQPDSSSQGQEFFVGIREEESGFNQVFNLAQFVDTTNIEVFELLDGDGEPTGEAELENAPLGADINSDGDVTFEEFSEFILQGLNGTFGWIVNFDTANGEPSERVTNDSATFQTAVAFSGFTPDDNICSPLIGDSSITIVDLVTGTATPEFFFVDPVSDTNILVSPDSAPNSGDPSRRAITNTISVIPGNIGDLGSNDPASDGLADSLLSGASSTGANLQFGVTGTVVNNVRRINWREIIQ